MTGDTPTKADEWRKYWPTVLTSCLGLSFTTLFVYSAGAFTVPIQHELGWGRSQITFGITVMTICSACMAPVVGTAVDAFGGRLLAIVGIFAYCAAFSLASLVATPVSWWLVCGIVGICGSALNPTVWTSEVTRRFVRSRGLALAFTLSGASIGPAVVPIVASALIGHVGWRLAYVVLPLLWGGVTLALVIPLFGRGGVGRATVQRAARAIDKSARALILSRRYLSIATAATLCAFVQMAFIISIIPLLRDQGMAARTAAGIAAMVGVAAILGRMTSGFLIDRIDARIVSGVSMAIPSVTAIILLTNAKSPAAAGVAVVLLGLSLGAELEAATYLTARYLGVRHFGLLLSIIMSCLALATGTGPLFASLIYDHTGSYHLMMWAAIPLSLTASALTASLGAPPRRDASGELEE